MKKIIYTLIFLISILKVYSQNTTDIDNLKYKCKYIITYQADSTNINSIESEEMLLLIGERSSKFLSLSSFLRDSISNNIDRENTNSINLMTLFQSVPKTKFKDKIFKNYPKDKITITEQVLKDYFIYEEPLNLFKWNIKNDSKIISGYNCQKATINYAGRDYIAWFTNEIPLSDGPYKFNGLPGLIIKINDTNNHYEYKLVSLKEQKTNNKIAINKKDYIKTTKKEFYILKKEFYKNIFKKLEQSGISINFENSSQKNDVLNKYRKRNNPIELENK